MKKSVIFFLSFFYSIEFLTDTPSSFADELLFLGGLTTVSNTAQYQNPLFKAQNFSAPAFGIARTIRLSPKFSWELGAFYQKKGLSYESPLSSSDQSTQVDLSVDYLDFPFLLRYSLVPRFLNLGLGPYFSFALSEVQFKTESGSSNHSTSHFQKSSRSKYEWAGFDYGLALSLRSWISFFSWMDVVLDIRYQLGLKNAFKQVNPVNGLRAEDSRFRDFLFFGGISFKVD